MQCACAVLSSVACPALQHFSTLSHKRYDFRRKVTEHKMCVLISSTTFVWNVFHSKKNWARYDQKCILVFMQSARYSCPILKNLEFSRQIFEKNIQISNFMNLRPVGAEFVPCGRTDTTKLIVAFRNFSKAPKMKLSTVFSLFRVWSIFPAHMCRPHFGYLTTRNTQLRSMHC